MREVIRIGKKDFKFKKDAINYYKDILNSYNFGDKLSDEHYFEIIDLLNYNLTDFQNNETKENQNEEKNDLETIEEDEEDCVVEEIRIAKVQFNTKCFEVIYEDGETEIISYRAIINQPKINYFNNFREAARNIVHKDTRSVKNEYFSKFSKKGYVPCQETGILSKWTELVVDHRQPNTFSVIVDRFIELNRIKLNEIEYKIDEENFYVFKDEKLAEEFRQYHEEKAVLRIVRKECNSSRAFQGRIKEQKKDLKIGNKTV